MLNWLKGTITGIIDWLSGTWKQFVDWIGDSVSAFVKYVSDLAVNIFEAAWDMLTDMISWIIEQLLDIVVGAANSLDIGGLQGFGAGFGLPEEIVNVMALCGVGSAVSIITAAIGVRLVLQLIPFTRLGS